MEHIEEIIKIKRETLSGEHYFQSLLERACMVQLLSESELEKIQFDCLTLLAKKTKQFNGGHSDSIRVEKAQDILASTMFTIGICLKTYQNPDDAVLAVQTLGVDALYTQGRKRINRLIGQTKMCHNSLVRHLLQTKNEFYASTIVNEMKVFFRLYEADFAAHEIHITADYPAYNKTQQLLGIEFIGQYLHQLYYENLFCTHFSPENIHYLLYGYNKHYENILLNIYEPVLAAALGCVIADIPVNSLGITSEIQYFLYNQFDKKTYSEIEELLRFALVELDEIFSFSDSLMSYIMQSLPQLAQDIKRVFNPSSLK